MPEPCADPASTPPAPSTPPPAVRASRAAAVFCAAALAALALAWELWLAPLRPGGSWLAVKALPALLPLAGMWRYRLYTYRWASLFVWLYAAEGCMRAWGDRWPGNALALAQLALCLGLFAACAVHVRLRLKAARSLPNKVG